MTKHNAKNCFKNNYMARRAYLMGIIESNPVWNFNCLWDYAPGHWGDMGKILMCPLGYALKVSGTPQAEFRRIYTDTAIPILVKRFGLSKRTFDRIALLNDACASKEEAVRAIRTFLLNKNWARAKAQTTWPEHLAGL